ncbi:MAG: hypothetical protein Q4C33_01680 [bacterium]|nr:hypothetical protein [bacterium]
MKKLGILIIAMCTLLLAGCSNKKGLDGSLDDIMTKVYEGIPSDDLPSSLETVKVTSENQSYYLGDITFDYKEAVASEPLMSSIAHSVVLIRLNDAKDADKAMKEIKEKVNPRKWVCVEVAEENVIVVNREDLVLLVMDDELAQTIKDNFLNIE